MFWSQSHLIGYEEVWAKKYETSGHNPEILRKGKKAVENLEAEFGSGTSLDTQYLCLLLKKPNEHHGFQSVDSSN